MFCRNCGKELSDEAIMCPNCGTPVVRNGKKKKPAAESDPASCGELKGKTGSIIAFTCSLIAFVCCVFFVSYTIACSDASFDIDHFSGTYYSYSSFDYPILPLLFGTVMGILVTATSLIGLLGGIYGAIHAAGVKKYKVFSITAIVFSATAIVLFFLLYCVFYIAFTVAA